jgi:hypothetical protein
MPQSVRNLRVTQWLGMTPVIAVCTQCKQQFRAPLAHIKSTLDAQNYLGKQFESHVCDSPVQSDPIASSEKAVRR